MKRLNPFRNLLVISGLFFFIISQSCVDSNYDLSRISDEMEIAPGISAPLIHGSISLDNILNEIKSEEYVGKFPDDSLIFITFSDSILSYGASDALVIPNQNFLQFYISSDISFDPAWLGSDVGDTLKFSKSKDGEFVVTHNEKIDSIKVKTATLKLEISSTFKHRGILHIYSNNIKTNGQSFSKTVTISDASGSFDITELITINNSTFTFDNSNPSLIVLPLSFELFLINSGAPILASESCDISMTYEDISFSSAYGYLGNYNLPIKNGQVDIGFYEEIMGDGELLFADPRFAVYFDNSFGIPVEIDISDVSAYSEKNNLTTPIIFTGGVNPFNIRTPDFVDIGKSVKDTITINKENCNIVEAMETSPKSFNYNINANSNPDGIGGGYNFITDSSRMDVDLEVVLPLWIRAQGIGIKDTLELDMEEEFGDAFDFITYFRITMEGKNGFPLMTSLQVYFTDDAYLTLDSLFIGSTVFLNPAEVGTNGKVTASADFKKLIELNKDKLQNVRDTKYIIVKVDVNTTNASQDQYVKFYSYYTFDFKMSVKTNLLINSRNL